MIEDRPFWVTAMFAAVLVAAAIEQLLWPVAITPVGWPLPFAYTLFLLGGSLLGVISLTHYIETRLEIWRRLGLAFLAGAAVLLGAALLWPGLVSGGDPLDLDFFDEWWLLTLQSGLFLVVLMVVSNRVASWPVRRQAWVVAVGGAAIAFVVGVVSEAHQTVAWDEWLGLVSSLAVAIACVGAAWYYARRYRGRRRRVYRYLVLVLVTSACGAAAHSVFTDPDTIGFYLTLALSGLPYVVMAAGLSGEYRSLLRARQDLARADFVNRVSAAAVSARSEARLLASVEREFAHIGYEFRASRSVRAADGREGGAQGAAVEAGAEDEGGAVPLAPVVVPSSTALEDRVFDAVPLSAEYVGDGLLSDVLWRSVGRVVGLSLARIEAEESAKDLARRMEQANASLRGFAVENAQLLEESSGRMRLLQAMVENTPTLTALVAVSDWTILHANQQLRQRLGDPVRIDGVSVTHFFPTVGGRQTAEALGRLVAGREPRFLPEVLVESPAAGAFWCDVHATPLYDPEGRPLHVLLCATDVTEAIRLRDSLEATMNRESRRSEELAAIVRSFPDALLMFDHDDHLIYKNPGAAAVLRLPQMERGFVVWEEALQRRRFLTPDGSQLRRDELPDARALRDEEGVALEVRMELDTGDEVQLLLCASPMRSPEGDVIGAAMTVRDITPMHRIQADLEEAVRAERRRSAQLHVLNQVVMSLNSEVDSGRMLDQVLTGAARLTGSLGSAYYSIDGDQLRLEVFSDLSGNGGNGESSRRRRDIRDIVGRALAERRQIRGGSEGVDDSQGYLVAPLFAGDGQGLGGLALWAPPVDTGFTADDEIFIATLTAHAAVALQNLRRSERERMIAVRLQRAMLPRVPRLIGLECDLVYESASEAALVGGDFYDLVPLSGGRTAVIVGDVCGKGLEAATQTARARYMLRAYAKFDYDPGRWLAEVNDSLQDDMAEGDFVTVALAVVDPKNLTMRYALAGHPPPWVVTDEHTIEVDGAPGLPLGVQSGETYPSYTVELGRGARLLFYSDGLYEARSTNELFGFEALPVVVRRLAGAPVRGFAELLAAEARAFAGGALKDDLVVVVLGLTGEG